jgi:hypothetical protein
LKSGCGLHQIKQSRITQAVENKPPFSAVYDQTCLAQDHEMLGDVSLPKFEQIFQMADTGFPRAKGQQYLNADWRTGSFKNITDGLIRGFNRIRYHEYIIFIIFTKWNMMNVMTFRLPTNTGIWQ